MVLIMVLSLNVNKTKYIFITPRGSDLSSVPLIHVRGLPVNRVSTAKYLGLMIVVI